MAGCFDSSSWGASECGCSSGTTATLAVHGCNGQPYPGVTVSLYTASGGTLLASGTTDAAGQVTLTWSGTATWATVTGASTRFASYSAAYTANTITLTPATAYVCIPLGNCLLPWKKALQGSSTLGPNVSFIYIAGTTQYHASNVTYSCPGCPACGCPASFAFVDYVFETAGPGLVTIKGNVFPGTACPDGGYHDANPTLTFATSGAVSVTCPPALQATCSLADTAAAGGHSGCFYCGNGPDPMTITE